MGPSGLFTLPAAANPNRGGAAVVFVGGPLLVGAFVVVLAAAELVAAVVVVFFAVDVEVPDTVDLGRGAFLAGAVVLAVDVAALGTTFRGDVAGVPVVLAGLLTVLAEEAGLVVEAAAFAARACEAAVGAKSRLVLEEVVDDVGATVARAGLGAVDEVAFDNVAGREVGGGLESLTLLEVDEVAALGAALARGFAAVDELAVLEALITFVDLFSAAGFGVGGSGTADFGSGSATVAATGATDASTGAGSSIGFVVVASVLSAIGVGADSPGLGIDS